MKVYDLEVPHVGCCQLTKMSGGAALRTSCVSGAALSYPRLGKSFYVMAAALDETVIAQAAEEGMVGVRMVNTSPLVEIMMLADNQGLVLVTASGSKYLLEGLENNG